MQSEMTLPEMIENIRAIFAKDLTGRPVRRGKPTSDPSLWRAIQNQEKNNSEGQCWLRSRPGKP